MVRFQRINIPCYTLIPLCSILHEQFIAFILECKTRITHYILSPDAIKVLEDGDLQTFGLLDYDKRLKHSFTAHPKIDPYTGKATVPNIVIDFFWTTCLIIM